MFLRPKLELQTFIMKKCAYGFSTCFRTTDDTTAQIYTNLAQYRSVDLKRQQSVTEAVVLLAPPILIRLYLVIQSRQKEKCHKPT